MPITRSLNALALVSAGLLFTACATDDSQKAASPVHSEQQHDEHLDRLAEWLTGSFSSAEQAINDPRYSEIHLRAVQIWADRNDGRWIYVEQAAATTLDRPYRQRVYQLTERPDARLVSTVYTLPGDPLNFAGDWRTPAVFDAIDPASLTERIGCDIVLSWDETTNTFEGSTLGDRCPSSLAGARYATSEVVLTANELRSWDRGFDASDQQVWGAEAGPYIFRRIDVD